VNYTDPLFKHSPSPDPRRRRSATPSAENGPATPENADTADSPSDNEYQESEWSTERLFREYISPFFGSSSENERSGGAFKILTVNDAIEVFGITCVCVATDPQYAHGIVDKNTLIYVDNDPTPEFRRIHVVPFSDTLPRAYNYDVFNDYLKPYFAANAHQRYRRDDQFTFQGVQFKVVCTDPEALGQSATGGRVGKSTVIYCEGGLDPDLRNLLPPELRMQMSYLPPGLQFMLLNTDAVAGSPELFER
jgi:hypothetical protein